MINRCEENFQTALLPRVGQLKTKIVLPADLSTDDRAGWIGLLQPDRWKSPLLHPDFTVLVGAARADTRIIIARDEEGRRAFLPVHLRPGGVCRPVGAVFSDLHDLIRDPACSISVTEILGAADLKSYPYFGLLSGEGPGQGELAHFDSRLHDGAAFDQLRAARPKHFKKIGRLDRKLNREIGAVELNVDDRDITAFEQVMDWKRTQLAACGRHDVLGPAWVTHMMNLLRDERALDVKGRLVTLRAGGQLLAAEFGVDCGGVFHPWIAAYNAEFGRYSPGILLMYRLFQMMPEAGIWRYDLGLAEGEYKNAFANMFLPVFHGAFQAKPDWYHPPSINQLAARPGIAGKIGRRWQQIILCELGLGNQLRGLLLAARSML